MREYPEHVADRPRGSAHAFPNPAVIDRDPSQQKPGILQSREVRRHELAPPLAFPALGSKLGGKCLDISVNFNRFHRVLPPLTRVWSQRRSGAAGR
jgi:hypothetical protein